MTIGLLIAAGVLAVVALLESEGRGLTAWAVLLLVIASLL